MASSHRRGLAITGALLALVLALAGCTVPGKSGAAQLTADQGFKVGLLLPESKTSRYETFDRPMIEDRLKRLCPRCEILYQNAEDDKARQQSQAETMLAQGAKVLILDPVDARAARATVTAAHAQRVPVIAYDRLADGPVAYHVSFDNRKIGGVQGQALVTALARGGNPRRGRIVMINGAPADPNAADFKAGARAALAGKVIIGRQYDTPDWSPDNARQGMKQAIGDLGEKNIIGVYAANDATAGGAIAALKAAGVDRLPPVTGQDAELAAIHRILAGDQYMTVYKAIRPEANVAGELAIAAATGRRFSAQPTVIRRNRTGEVTSVLLAAVVVTRDNIRDTVLADGLYSKDQICTAAYARACAAAGIV